MGSGVREERETDTCFLLQSLGQEWGCWILGTVGKVCVSTFRLHVALEGVSWDLHEVLAGVQGWEKVTEFEREVRRIWTVSPQEIRARGKEGCSWCIFAMGMRLGDGIWSNRKRKDLHIVYLVFCQKLSVGYQGMSTGVVA